MAPLAELAQLEEGAWKKLRDIVPHDRCSEHQAQPSLAAAIGPQATNWSCGRAWLLVSYSELLYLCATVKAGRTRS